MKNYKYPYKREEPKKDWSIFWLSVSAICLAIILFFVALAQFWIKFD